MVDTAAQLKAVGFGRIQRLGTTANVCNVYLTKCRTHVDHRLENFCVDHELVCCYECLASIHRKCTIQPLDEMTTNLNEVELKRTCSTLDIIIDQTRAAVEDITDETNAVPELIDFEISESVGDSKNQNKHHRIDALKMYMNKLCLLCKEIVDVLYVVKQTFVYCSTHNNDSASIVKFLKSKQRIEELCHGLWMIKNKLLRGEFEIAFNGNVTSLKENVDRVRKHVKNFLQALNGTTCDIEKQSDHKKTSVSDRHKTFNSTRNDDLNHVDTNPAQRHAIESAVQGTKEIEVQEPNTDTSHLKKDPQSNVKETSELVTKEVSAIQIDDLELRLRENDSQIDSRLDNVKTKMDVDKTYVENLKQIGSDNQHDIPIRSGIFLDAPGPVSVARPLVQDVILSKNRVLTKESNPPGYLGQAIQVQHKLKLEMTKQMFVKLPNDVYPCDIYDIACMPDGKVIVSDRNNSFIKLFNEDNDHVKYLHTKYPPYSVVCVSNTLFMFVCGHAKNRLNLASITTGLEVRQEFTTNHACVALATNNSFIYVLCNNDFRTEIHILNAEGVVNMKIDIGNHVKYPQYIAVDPITERIHVTDNEGVYSVDRSGRQVTHIRDTAISGYHGIATDNRGNIFLCTRFPDGVYAIPRTKTYLKPLLLGAKMQHVHAMCYSERDNSILVSFSNSDFIRQYRIISD